MTETRTQKPETTAPNCLMALGTKVHAGRWEWNPYEREWMTVPACQFSRNSLCYGYETELAVTCKRCSKGAK